jgi:hypothetical protein
MLAALSCSKNGKITAEYACARVADGVGLGDIDIDAEAVGDTRARHKRKKSARVKKDAAAIMPVIMVGKRVKVAVGLARLRL